jgi:hypothetical protein
MTRINITVEGKSELNFVQKILYPHLLNFDKVIDARPILTNKKQKKRGGMPTFDKIRNDISQWIKEQPHAWHTSLIDLYGLKADFPGYDSTRHLHYTDRILEIEKEFGSAINHWRFIPHIQLHEYEAMLFSSPIDMEEWLGLYNNIPASCFQDIRNQFNNPEHINDNPLTAPSKRIISIVGEDMYDKVDDGVLILEEIGLIKIRQECPHFDSWLTKLESLSD